MADRKSDRRPPITNRSLTESEQEQDNDELQHVRTASNPGSLSFFVQYLVYLICCYFKRTNKCNIPM
jgi:hypothetical protein